MDKPLTFGSLFVGIGGIDLGLERAGLQCAWQVEIDDYATKVLAKHWPDVARFRDVRTIGRHIGDIHTCYIPVPRVDVLAGGFPCQPHSQAGERKASKDERDLWPEFYRLIRELEPRWVMAENVLGLLSSENGAFFGGILRDLAKAGYDAQWRVLSAAQFGAPHLRERVILVAYTSQSRGWIRERSDRQTWAQVVGRSQMAHANRTKWRTSTEGRHHVVDWTDTGWQETASGFEFCGEELAHTSKPGLSIRGCAGYTPNGAQDGTGMESQLERYGELADASSTGWQEWDTTPVTGEQGHAAWRKIAPGKERQHQSAGGPQGTQSLFEQSGTWAIESCLGELLDGISTGLVRYRWPAGPGQEQHEWEPPRVITERVPNRTKMLKGLGNAVVPVLAEAVGRCIVAVEAERRVVA